ncbi:MAG: translocation/assembly module TamB domain-containing protein [Planctomycetes bacterium]|nr:translocation/assembly module TamB domain-containing protein [Planctomycetota bacterium]
MLGLVACGAGVYALRASVLAPWIVELIAAKLRADHGLELAVGAVRGNWFSTLELDDVRVSKLDGSLDVAVRELHAGFSLGELYSGGIRGVELVRASGVDVRFDREKRAPRAPRAADSRSGSFEWPERWPKCFVDDARVELVLGGGRSVSLAGLEVGSTDGERFVARATDAAYVSPETAWPAGACGAEWRMRGGRAEFAKLDLAGVEVLESGALDLAEVTSGRLGWEAKLALQFGRIATRGTLRGVELSTLVALDGVDGARLRALFPPLARREWSGTLDVEAQFDARIEHEGTFELAVRGGARDGAFASQHFERLTTELVVTRERVLFSRLDVQRGVDRLAANDFVVPFGPKAAAGLRGHVALDSSDVPTLLGDPELGRDVPEHRVHLAATFTDHGLILDEGRVTTESGVLDIDAGRVVFGATAERWLTDLRVDLAGRADFPDLEELGGALGREGWCGSVRGRVALAGGLETLEGALDLEGSNVEIEGRALGDVHAAVRIDRERIRVERAHATGVWGELEVSGEFDYRALRFHDASVAARLALPVPWAPPWIGAGAVEGHARLDGPLDAPRVEFNVAARDVAYGERTLESLDARGVWEGARVRFDHLVLRTLGLDVVATGELSSLDWRPPFAVSLESLHAARDGRSLDLVAPVELRIGDGKLEFDHAYLAGDAGRWVSACHWTRERVVVQLELVELSPLGLFDPFLPEGVDVDGLHGELEVLREGEKLTAAFDLGIDRMRLHSNGRTYAFALSGLLDDSKLELAKLELAEGERRVLSLSGTAPFDPLGPSLFAPGELDLVGSLAILQFDELPQAWRPRGAEPSGQVHADLRLGGTWLEPRGRLELDACDLELDGIGVLAGRRLGPWDVEAAVTFDESVRIEHLRLEDRGRASAFVSGELRVAPRPLAWFEQGLPDTGDVGLDLVAGAAVEDLSFVRRFAPELGRVGGRAYTELAFGASLAAPTWSGSLQLADGEVRFENDLPKLTALNADVAFSGYTATVRSCTGALGAGPFEIGGTVELVDGVPHFALNASGQEILLARGDNLRLRADAELAFTGPLDAMRIAGELRLRDGRYTKNFELLARFAGSGRRARAETQRGFLLPAITRGPFARAEFDIDVRNANALRIDNNVLRAGVRPNLKLRGRGSAPRLAGTIFVENARISLPSGSLRITGGSIALEETNPLVPKLKLRGEARLAGYDVVASLDGAYDEPIVLSSSPPMSQSDLIVLLLTGRPPASTLSATSERAAQSVAVYLGQDVLSRWLGGDEKGESLVERIEWLQGQELTKSGGQTTQVSLRLTADEGDARRIVYLRGEKDVYDRVNFGIKLLFRFP